MKAKTSSTERIDRRYLLVKAESKQDIEEALLHFLGALWTSKAAPLFPEVPNLKNGEFILAIGRKELDNVRAALEISKKPMQTVKVSGTLKGLGF